MHALIVLVETILANFKNKNHQINVKKQLKGCVPWTFSVIMSYITMNSIPQGTTGG